MRGESFIYPKAPESSPIEKTLRNDQQTCVFQVISWKQLLGVLGGKKKHQTPGGVLKWGGTPKIHPSLFGMFRYKLQTIQLLGYLSYGNLHIYFTKGPRAWCMFETEKKSSNLNLYNETSSSCNLWVQTQGTPKSTGQSCCCLKGAYELGHFVGTNYTHFS